ncbi:hypothetical protein [Cellulomonas wangsupingiae]|uniref:Uncharacterized protein n=1 Tax=Cellulomonas wangsupingiae TaxID=2968085 RepID=A0ABY5K9K7_9CELL|nr:hypothetical protein [Cellulomonas wangsupingiae]UUI67122.1 hypothetical protein NP075_05565 [Cellulomonas wangsupingiae]
MSARSARLPAAPADGTPLSGSDVAGSAVVAVASAAPTVTRPGQPVATGVGAPPGTAGVRGASSRGSLTPEPLTAPCAASSRS